MLGWQLRYIFNSLTLKEESSTEVLVITDKIPVNKKRSAVEKGIKQTLADKVSPRFKYQIFHHESKSSLGLQVADYCNWAIYKKWTDGDSRSYDRIQNCIKSEYEIFKIGTQFFY